MFALWPNTITFFILWPNFPNAETEAQREEVVFLTDSVEVPVTYQENDKSQWGGTKPWGTAGGQPKGVLLSPMEHTSRRVQLEAEKGEPQCWQEPESCLARTP